MIKETENPLNLIKCFRLTAIPVVRQDMVWIQTRGNIDTTFMDNSIKIFNIFTLQLRTGLQNCVSKRRLEYESNIGLKNKIGFKYSNGKENFQFNFWGILILVE